MSAYPAPALSVVATPRSVDLGRRALDGYCLSGRCGVSGPLSDVSGGEAVLVASPMGGRTGGNVAATRAFGWG